MKKLLETKGIRPSINRIKILDYLVRYATHPTVDEIYSNLIREMPTLSKTTVYNSLELFVDANLARVLTVGDNEHRYDANISEHGHFICNECRKVYDFEYSVEKLVMEELEGFQIQEKNIYCRGICPECYSAQN